jgi:hypothetical protein
MLEGNVYQTFYVIATYIHHIFFPMFCRCMTS